MIYETSHLRKYKSVPDPDTQTKIRLSSIEALADSKDNPKNIYNPLKYFRCLLKFVLSTDCHLTVLDIYMGFSTLLIRQK